MSSLNRFVTLGEISDRIGDGLHGTPAYSENGEYFFINGNNLLDGEIIFNEKTKSCSKFEYDKYKKDLSNNTILISINGTIGNLAFYKGENVILGKSACYINIKSDVDKNFIYYALKSSKFQNYIKSQATGSTIKNVSLKLLRDYVLELPDIIQQKRISKILSTLDDKIHLNNQINQTLESIAQAIFKSWFIDFEPVRAKIAAKLEGADPEIAAMCVISGKSEAELKKMPEDDFAELQATAVLFPDELVESELGEVPKGWEVTRFNKIILQYIDNRGKTPPTQIDGIPLLEVKHLPEGSLNPDLNTEKRVSLETFNNWFRAHLQEDDLIISTVGTIGRLCIIPADKKLTIAQNILGLRFKKDEVNPLFMYYQMDSCKFRNDVNARLVITVQASIKRKDLETIDLLKPDINIQNVFAEKIKPFVLSQQSDESLKLIDIRDTLLPKLLSGEVSVEDIKQQQDLA